MDKGKSAAPSSQGIAASAWEQSSTDTDSDDERGEAAGWAPRVLGAGDDGASSSSAPSATPTQAIAPFEDGQYVRLRNSGRGGYLFASEDGWGVRVDSRRGMVNTAWAVQILRTADTAHVLLRSAYGRYLSPKIIPAGFGLVGCYTTQCLFEYPHPEMQWSTTMGRHGSVVLFQVTDAGMRALRANGRYLRWNTDVTFAPVNLNHISPMMEWEVQVIPQRSETPPYQTRPPNAAIAGPLRGSRAPTAAAARGEEVSVTAPILTVDNVHCTFLPVLDARRRVRGHVRGSLIVIEGLRERVARGGDEGALNIRADILASELGAGYIGFRGRPRVIAVVYHGKRVIVNDRLHVLAAEEARVQNEDIHDRGADAEQNLPRVGEVQGAGVEQPEPHPDGHLGGDADVLEPRPVLLHDTAHVLLRSAYGRYLSPTINSGRFGLVGCYTTQCIFEYPDPEIEWSTSMGKRGSVVLLQVTDAGMRALRANGRYLRWNTDVTFGPVNLNHISSMMEWEVQVIPLTLETPPYQTRPQNAAIRFPKGSEDVIDIAYSHAWFDDNGSIEHAQWIAMRFRGRSLTRLRNEIANRLGVQSEKMTLFTQAGLLAQPIPLLTDLHLRDDPRMILAFMVDAPGYSALRFPDLAAE